VWHVDHETSVLLGEVIRLRDQPLARRRAEVEGVELALALGRKKLPPIVSASVGVQ
jgi:hypothetical protein